MYVLSDEVLQLGQHEGDWEYWEQTDKEIVSGHWIIEIEEGKPARLYCDAVARKCFGISANGLRKCAIPCGRKIFFLPTLRRCSVMSMR